MREALGGSCIPPVLVRYELGLSDKSVSVPGESASRDARKCEHVRE